MWRACLQTSVFYICTDVCFSACTMLEKNACVILTCSVLNPCHSDDSSQMFHYLYLMRSLSDVFSLFFILLTDFPSVIEIILSCLCLLSPLSSVEQSWLSWMLYYPWQQPAGTALSWRCDQALWRRAAGQRLPCWAVCRRGPWRYHPLHPWRTCLLCWPLAFMCSNDWSTTMPGWKIQILLQLKCKERACAYVCALVGIMAWEWNGILAAILVCKSIYISIHPFQHPLDKRQKWS